MLRTPFTARLSWEKVFSYGEVVCFVSAWAIGLLLAMQGADPGSEPTATRSIAATSEVLGVQARLVTK